MGKNQNSILLVLVVLLAVIPFFLQQQADFSGADDQVLTVVQGVNPEYKPWFSSIWQPPSAEIENFLFALQAALGAGFIGYFFGYYQGRKASKKKQCCVDEQPLHEEKKCCI